MKDLTLRIFDRIRFRVPGLAYKDPLAGVFVLPSVDGMELRIVASACEDWDHVSVSREDRCPDWYEMEQVKRLFFWPHETAMQLHVPPADHINNHNNCLHIWRPQHIEIPRPPSIMVGLRSVEPGRAKRLAMGLF